MSDEQKIRDLAEKLKSKGLACSKADALEKARDILGGINNNRDEILSDEENKKKAIEDLKKRAIDSTNEQTFKKEEKSEIFERKDKIIEKNDYDSRIDKINEEVKIFETKKNSSQRKLDKEEYDINSLEEDYDVIQDERTLGEIMQEAEQEIDEERDNEAEKDTDEYVEELEDGDYSGLPSIDEIENVSESEKNDSSDDDFIKMEDEDERPNFTKSLFKEEDNEDEELENLEEYSVDEENQDLGNSDEDESDDELEDEKPSLTKEEKEASDLTRIFNFNKRK